jgi:predicted ATPase/DNA-binding SARP family transcriptional activator
MRFRLLGRLEVGDGGTVRGARERRLLALLLLEAPAAVAQSAVVDWLVGVDSPVDRSAVHIAVSRLRRQLRDLQVDAAIERTPAGLRIVTDLDTIDRVRFERLVGEAATLRGLEPEHRDRLREALDLWRGPVLAGEDIRGHPVVTKLGELRFAALEKYFEAGVAIADDSGDLPELLAWCQLEPPRERFCALAMQALYRHGRHVEALALYQATRTRLVEMFGLEPGPDLVELERRVLCHDPTLIGRPPPVANGKPDAPPARVHDLPPGTELGNLPAPATSFIGRERELRDVVGMVRSHRLVTLTGVGGVGKTRLAMQAASLVADEHADGVWLVELAPATDQGVVADLVATALGITTQARLSVTDSIVSALSGRRVLLVLDNCEHVLDAAADLVEAILAKTTTVRVLATSREQLGLAAQHVWAVPPLGLQGEPTSDAVALFVERARAAVAGFALTDEEAVDAVDALCRGLDGIALAIELAAARMVSMSPQDVRDRLDDRFRLLSGSARRGARHQTLRHAVRWSYDLFNERERLLLQRCSVFADGFDLAAAAQLNDDLDEFGVVEGLDSLVRKSLVNAWNVRGHVRYGMLETIRQFAGDELASTGMVEDVRDRHAAYFAVQTLVHWELWQGAEQWVASDWLEVELANLRSAFRWAREREDVRTAAAIAAHAALIGMPQERFEPVTWAEEIVPLASDVRLAQLPRVLTAASLCTLTGRPDAGAEYARTAVSLGAQAGYDPFPDGLSQWCEGLALLHAGQFEQGMAIYTELVDRGGPVSAYGFGSQTMVLVMTGRSAESVAVAWQALASARELGNPFFLAKALYSWGLAQARTDPAAALDAFHEGLAYCREHRQRLVEASIARDAARVEAAHGDLDVALVLYERALDLQHRSGNLANLAVTLASLAVSFDRLQRPDAAAVLYGSSAHITASTPDLVHHLRTALDDTAFDRHAAIGAAMGAADAVAYARAQIELVRGQLGRPDVLSGS